MKTGKLNYTQYNNPLGLQMHVALHFCLKSKSGELGDTESHPEANSSVSQLVNSFWNGHGFAVMITAS